MKRPWKTWARFTLCASVVLAAMAWVSSTTIRLDKSEASAKRTAQRQEAIRLALWRMDSALGPLISHVAGLPPFVFSSFYPADGSYAAILGKSTAEDRMLPSPLMQHEHPYVSLYFQIDAEGRITSPQVPTGERLNTAVDIYTTREKIDRYAQNLEKMQASLDYPRLDSIPWVEPSTLMTLRDRPAGIDSENRVTRGAPSQQQRNAIERSARIAQQAMVRAPDSAMLNAFSIHGDVISSEIHALWSNEDLLLLRRVSSAGRGFLQGALLDWPGIRQWLLREVATLLPHATLVPARNAPDGEKDMMLAALPLRLVPGEIDLKDTGNVSPVLLSLTVAWVCVILAVAAAAVLLAGTINLSERRSTFVSAVTHEMRTPLTTLSMYTDMLIKGMIEDETKRDKYLRTVHREAQRLSHLVENVLAFSKLEHATQASSEEVLSVETIITRVRERLETRAVQSGFSIEFTTPTEVLSTGIRTNLSAVEQILLNLVDNACKYAKPTTHTKIRLEAGTGSGGIELSVIDSGQGISEKRRSQLFHPFHKSAEQAAGTQPGVGLGLALSRELARRFGGDLRLDDNRGTGTRMILTLPLA